jgi:TonB family protein
MTNIPENGTDSGPAIIPGKDRRLHARQRIRSLSYVELGDSNGGIVLNISEGGIAVQAAQVLDEGPVSMRLQIPGSKKPLEVSGEIVWTGDSRKEAGLRFVDLQESALKKIRGWIAREALPVRARGEQEDKVEDDDDIDIAVEPEEEVVEEEILIEAQEIEVETDEFADDGPRTSVEVAATTDEMEEPEGEREEPEEEIVEAANEPEELVVPHREFVARAEEGVRETEKLVAAAPAAHKEEARPHIPATPNRNFETNTQIPISPFNAISGTHGAPSFGRMPQAPVPPVELRNSSIDAEPTLFPRPHSQGAAKADDGWKSFRVQLQTGWFLAALVLLLALISFVAGMAVRRGALNGVMGDVDDIVQPRSAPSLPATNPVATVPAGDASGGAGSSVAAKPLEIEIVDLNNRRWILPATNGSSHADASATRPSRPSDSTTTERNAATSPARSSETINSSQPAQNSGAPLMLSLPETPISASGSVAIRSRSMVPVPNGEIESAQRGRNLQIGQLMNLIEPVYPPQAQQSHLEGTVKLHAVIGADGSIQSLQPVEGPEMLAQSAMTAVRQWKYSPTMLNGKAIATQEDVTFVFRVPK